MKGIGIEGEREIETGIETGRIIITVAGDPDRSTSHALCNFINLLSDGSVCKMEMSLTHRRVVLDCEQRIEQGLYIR